MQCTECRIEINADMELAQRYAGLPYCGICHAMIDTLSGRMHWIDLHADFENEQRRKKRLAPGADYL